MRSKIISVSMVVLLAIFTYVYFHQLNEGKRLDQLSNKEYSVVFHTPFSHMIVESFLKGLNTGLLEKGLVEGQNIKIIIKNGQGDNTVNQTISQTISKDDYDLFLPFGTQSAQGIVNLVKDKPIVFGVVTDPVKAKLIDSIENPGANVTGTTDAINDKANIILFKKIVPTLKKVGVLYNPSEANSIAGLENLKKIETEVGVKFVIAPVSSTNDVFTSAKSIVSRVDGFYSLQDVTVVAGQESIIKVALENKKPYFSIDGVETVKKGSLISVGANYEKLGITTGILVADILLGNKKTYDTPVQALSDENLDIFLNQKTADRLGIKFPEELLQQAKEIVK